MNKSELKKRIDECTKLGWWYQPMKYGTEAVPVKKMNEQCFGHGKWKNFIESLLTKDIIGNGLFADFGCNAGLYLLKAFEYGFDVAYGIEAGISAFAQLELTKDYHTEHDIRILFYAIGKLEKNIAKSNAYQMNFLKFPIVDLSLLANVTYWIQDEALKVFASMLANKSKHVIIVTSTDIKEDGDNWKRCFNGDDWKIVTMQSRFKQNDDEREMYSVLLESKRLIKIDVDDMFKKYVLNRKHNKLFYTEIWPTFVKDCEDDSVNRKIFDWLTNGQEKTAKHTIIKATEKLISLKIMVNEMKHKIMLEPIMITGNKAGDYIDGFHRLGTAKELKMKYIYAKEQ